MDNFSMAFMAFLNLTDYLPKEQLAALHKELAVWEKRKPWEKLKEQGDFWLAKDEGERAYGFYTRALKLDQNVPLYNNAAIALMQMGKGFEAAGYFKQAGGLEPSNLALRFNQAEALVLAGELDEATSYLQELAKKCYRHPELAYLQGEIQFRQRNFLEAARLFSAALELKYDHDYMYRLSDCYMKIRQFDKAFEVLERVPPEEQDTKFLKKQAEHLATAGNLPAAIKSIERALVNNSDKADLWATKAGYHRLDYNLVRAQGSIGRAITAAPDNYAVLLENARIRKAQGRTKDYQDILHEILNRLKKDYRRN